MRQLGEDVLGESVVLIATEGVTDPEGYARVTA